MYVQAAVLKDLKPKTRTAVTLSPYGCFSDLLSVSHALGVAEYGEKQAYYRSDGETVKSKSTGHTHSPTLSLPLLNLDKLVIHTPLSVV